MFQKLTPHKIVLPTEQEGWFLLTITTQDSKTVFTDSIYSQNQEIVLRGFSEKQYRFSLVPIINNPQ
ncbi:hypothetical protein KIH23_01300 [Flavobacterium sp. CYK-55]|uniref:hypothetical protein n=1 Tax=Flavobacterium sp. CYK-55 TaxID=2835529 RepID=UPI001BCCBB5B|nr:hypothetical protein [Flavobacterium sp. CYK-55]MBS7785918.1 hypothetical protein [Flavobacterium sp. CYK-55]